MRLFGIIFAVSVIIAASCHGAVVSLPDAIELALKNNSSLAASALRVQGGSIDIEGASSIFKPQLIPDGTSGISNGDDYISAGLTLSKRFKWGTQVSLGSHHTETDDETVDSGLFRGIMHLDITQPLLQNAGKMINTEPIRQAASSFNEAARILELQKNDIVLTVAESYMNLLMLEQQIRSAQDTVARMEKLYKLTKARESHGRTTRVDTLRVKLQLEQDRARKEEKEQTYASEMQNLLELMGAASSEVITLEPVPFLREILPESDEAIQTALANRLDHAQLLQDREDTARGILISRKRMWPSLNLVFRYDRHEDDIPADDDDFEKDDWFVGLTADTDLLNSDKRVNLKRAELDTETAEANIRVNSAAIARQVQQHIILAQRNQRQVELAQTNLTLASKRRDLARKLFEIGRGDNFSVTDAENSYLTAEDNLLSAHVASTLEIYRLRRAMGTLIESPEYLKSSAKLSQEIHENE